MKTGFLMIFRAVRARRRGFVLAVVLPPAVAMVLLVLVPVAGWHLTYEHPLRTRSEKSVVDGLQGETGEQFDRVAQLARDQRFLEARLALAERKEIGLSLDLAERILQVEMDGVPLRQSPILEAHVSKALPYALFQEGPNREMPPALLTLSRARATIPKAPIRIVEAPRDTVEAAARPPLAIPEDDLPPHVLLTFEEKVILYIRPVPDTFPGALLGMAYRTGEHLRLETRTVAHILRGQVPTPVAWVEVEVAPSDARAIYRALSNEAHLALRLP